jgi:hypothetical protein
MCTKNGFEEKRIRSGAEKLKKARTGKQQGRLDSFFSVLPSSAGPKVSHVLGPVISVYPHPSQGTCSRAVFPYHLQRKADPKASAKSKKKKVSGKGKPRK